MSILEEQFNKIITYSQGIENPQTKKLFADWRKNKEHIIQNCLGGKLIYEAGEVVFRLDEQTKRDNVDNLVCRALSDNLENLASFLLAEKDYFYNNKVEEEYKTKEGKCIPKGMKIIKAFKYFIKENPELLNDYQMKASELIQEDKIKGTLCFSVHPFDFLSLSENTYNWRSCHSLDGTYRAGNLSYMADSATVIIYLRGEQEVQLPHFPKDIPWNSKKWRMLIHMNDDHSLMFAGRQYPFSTTSIFDLLDKFWKSADPNFTYTPWINKYYTHENIGGYDIKFPMKFLSLYKGPIALNKMIDDYKQKLHYNDVLYSSSYTEPYYRLALYKNDNPFSEHKWLTACEPADKVHVGNEVKCLRCGENLIESAESTMQCFDCELAYGTEENDTFGFCDRCGARMILDEGTYLEYNSKIYCHTCAMEYIVECDCCGETMDLKDLQEEDGFYFCDCCATEKVEE